MKEFHCPRWPMCACPDGSIELDCPGHTITAANDDLSPADRLLNRIANFAAERPWPTARIVLPFCILIGCLLDKVTS